MRGFYLRSYMNTIRGTSLLPAAPADVEVMLKYFLLEKALVALNYELVMRPERAIIPLVMIRDILRPAIEPGGGDQLA
jgi:maltose alpha-D-glucosyltransferase/alpha-amylase